MDVRFTDNSDKVLEALHAAGLRALERCGSQAEGYAVDLVPVDTSNLKQSITHRVVEPEMAVHIGTNTEYGPYVELGTGEHYPGGRRTPWVYQDKEGHWHHTHGQRAQPFLKPAVADHKQTYRNIINDEMRNG